MANGRNDFIKLSEALSDFVPATLTDDVREELDVIDISKKRANPFPVVEPGTALASGPILTPGQRVQGSTPMGVAEPQEISDTGGALSQVGKALENPAVLNFLSQMGIAFSKGIPTEPGTILGQGVQRQLRGQGVARVASKVLAGEQLSPQDLAGLGPEDITSALSVVEQRERSQARERGLDIESELGTRRLDIQDRVVDLQERGIDLDEERFGLEALETVEGIAIAEGELSIAEKDAGIRARLAPLQIELLRAQAEALRTDPSADPEAQARLLRARNETIGLMSQMIERERERLNVLETEFESDVSLPLENVLRTIDKLTVQPQPGLISAINQARGRNVESSELTPIVERQRNLVENLESQLEEVVGVQAGELGPGSEEVQGTTEQGSTQEVQVGTRNNPIPLTEQTNIEELETGQILVNPGGILLEWTGTGFRRIQ